MKGLLTFADSSRESKGQPFNSFRSPENQLGQALYRLRGNMLKKPFFCSKINHHSLPLRPIPNVGAGD